MRRFAFAAHVFVVMMVFAVPAHAEKSLSSYQQKIHDEVNAGLDSVDASLTDARDRLNSGDGAGASTTCNTAVRIYNNHIRRISQLPADHSLTVAVREKAAMVGTKIKETADAIQAGAPDGNADKPVKETGKKADRAAPKLDYKQQEKLKNARYYLKEIDPRAARIFELTAGELDAEAIADALELMKFVRQRMGFVSENLNALPAEHPEVSELSQQFNELLEKLVAAQEAIEKAAPEADKEIARLGEQINQDLAIVDSWSQVLGNPQALFHNRPDDAIVVIGQMPQMRDTLDAMLQRWNARSTEKPNDRIAEDMVRKLKYVEEQFKNLEQYTEKQRKSLPEAIRQELAEVEKLITTAVTERRPLYFGPDGGVQQRFATAAQKVTLLKAIDPAAGGEADQSLAAVREKSAAAQKTLAQDIIDGNKKPAERYAGSDVEDLRQRVIATWKEAYPDDEIIAVIFNTEGWSRTTRWDWSEGNKGFGKVDYDHIQPKLFYKLDDKHAVEMPVEIYKDYMKNERIVVKPWEKEPEPSVTRTYLLDNLK